MRLVSRGLELLALVQDHFTACFLGSEKQYCESYKYDDEEFDVYNLWDHLERALHRTKITEVMDESVGGGVAKVEYGGGTSRMSHEEHVV